MGNSDPFQQHFQDHEYGAIKSNIPRFRRLQEYIGQSYFEYLSNLKDLVLLMDESHRYQASAGMKAVSEFKPILGLELTATPREEKGSTQEAFRAKPASKAHAAWLPCSLTI